MLAADGGGRAGFAEKPRSGFGIQRIGELQDLDRHRAIELRVLRLVDFAHRAGAELLDGRDVPPTSALTYIDQLEDALAALNAASAVDAERPVFTTYGANGLIAGAGTLEADVARAAGYATLGERLGVAGLANISLEQLIVSTPDVVAPSSPGERPPSLADQGLQHPALKRFLAERSVVDVPDPLWTCGTTRTVEAAARLVAARERGER